MTATAFFKQQAHDLIDRLPDGADWKDLVYEASIIQDIEGLDFLETKLERLEESHRRGVRTMQLVHYTPNDIGDFQTGAVVHNGLTPFGADVIRACNRLGVVVDVAHATADTVKQAVKVSSKPLLLSHTALRGSRAQGTTPLTERSNWTFRPLVTDSA